MRRLIGTILTLAILLAPLVFSTGTALAAGTSASNCTPKQFLGLDPWYKYLQPKTTIDTAGRSVCVYRLYESGDDATGKSVSLNSIWLIGLVAVDDLLRVLGLVAVGFILYGGFQYLTSQGEPDRAKSARTTITNALIGVVLASIAVVTINFIGSELAKQSAPSTPDPCVTRKRDQRC
jgi:hypothetical protein